MAISFSYPSLTSSQNSFPLWFPFLFYEVLILRQLDQCAHSFVKTVLPKITNDLQAAKPSIFFSTLQLLNLGLSWLLPLETLFPLLSWHALSLHLYLLISCVTSSPIPTLKFVIIFFFFNIYFWDRERQSMNGGGSERGRHRIWNRLQALSCQHRARRRARTHGPRDHDLSWSRPLNRLSHPGTPQYFFNSFIVNCTE